MEMIIYTIVFLIFVVAIVWEKADSKRNIKRRKKAKLLQFKPRKKKTKDINKKVAR